MDMIPIRANIRIRGIMKNIARKIKYSGIISLVLLTVIAPLLIRWHMKRHEAAQYVLVAQQYLNIILLFCVALLFFGCFYEKIQGKGREIFYLTDRRSEKELFSIFALLLMGLVLSTLLFYQSHIAQTGFFLLQYVILAGSLLSFCYAVLYVTHQPVLVVLAIFLFYGVMINGPLGTDLFLLYQSHQQITAKTFLFSIRYELLLGVVSIVIGAVANKKYIDY